MTDENDNIEAKPPSSIKKRSRGRPKQKEIAAKKRGNRGKRGRPPGDAAIINEYKARMLASPKSNLVLETIFDAALDNEHKNQAAAWKLLMDRMLPLSYFDKDKDTGGRSAIKISISGVPNVSVGNDIVDGEWEAVNDEE